MIIMEFTNEQAAVMEFNRARTLEAFREMVNNAYPMALICADAAVGRSTGGRLIDMRVGDDGVTRVLVQHTQDRYQADSYATYRLGFHSPDVERFPSSAGYLEAGWMGRSQEQGWADLLERSSEPEPSATDRLTVAPGREMTAHGTGANLTVDELDKIAQAIDIQAFDRLIDSMRDDQLLGLLSLEVIWGSGCADDEMGSVDAPYGHIYRVANWTVVTDEAGNKTVTEHDSTDEAEALVEQAGEFIDAITDGEPDGDRVCDCDGPHRGTCSLLGPDSRDPDAGPTDDLDIALLAARRARDGESNDAEHDALVNLIDAVMADRRDQIGKPINRVAVEDIKWVINDLRSWESNTDSAGYNADMLERALYRLGLAEGSVA